MATAPDSTPSAAALYQRTRRARALEADPAGYRARRAADARVYRARKKAEDASRTGLPPALAEIPKGFQAEIPKGFQAARESTSLSPPGMADIVKAVVLPLLGPERRTQAAEELAQAAERRTQAAEERAQAAERRALELQEQLRAAEEARHLGQWNTMIVEELNGFFEIHLTTYRREACRSFKERTIKLESILHHARRRVTGEWPT